MAKELLSPEQIMELAISKGADEVEIFVNNYRTMETKIEKNELQITTEDSGETIGVRMIKNNRQGFSTTNTRDSITLEKILDSALGIAALSPPDQYHTIPAPQPITERVKDIYDSRAEKIEPSFIVHKAEEIITKTKKIDNRISIDSGSFQFTESNTRLINSKGTNLSEKETAFTAVILEFAKTDDTVTSFQTAYNLSRLKDGINLDKLVQKTAEKTLRSINARPFNIESFRGQVLLTPESAFNLVVYPINYSINSDNIQKQNSYFRDKLNTRIAPKFITLTDDGSIAGKNGSSSFDREGLPHKKLIVIKEGILKSFLYNSYTAGKERRETTGHAAGGASTTPYIEITNLFFEPGNEKNNSLIKNIKRGLIVTRYSGEIDPVTGDFSGLVKGGFWVEGGQIKYPVTGCMISGNCYSLLENTLAISKEREEIYNMLSIPYFLFDNISITST